MFCKYGCEGAWPSKKDLSIQHVELLQCIHIIAVVQLFIDKKGLDNRKVAENHMKIMGYILKMCFSYNCEKNGVSQKMYHSLPPI